MTTSSMHDQHWKRHSKRFVLCCLLLATLGSYAQQATQPGQQQQQHEQRGQGASLDHRRLLQRRPSSTLFPFVGSYRSLRCQPDYEYPGPKCPVRHKGCAPDSNCTWPMLGAFSAWPQLPPNRRTHVCAAATCKDIDLIGRMHHDVWRPKGCSMAWLTPPEAYQCLRGVRVLMVGDSMMRQMHNRLVVYMRGISDVVEHKHQYNAVYLHNGTHDAYLAGHALPHEYLHSSSSNSRVATAAAAVNASNAGGGAGGGGPSAAELLPPGGAAEEEAARIMDVSFLWTTTRLPEPSEIATHRPDVLVAAIMYHTLEDTLAWVPAHLDAIAAANPQLRAVYWVATPRNYNWRDWEKVRAERNAAMRAAIRQRAKVSGGGSIAGSAGKRGGIAWHVVPFDYMAFHAPYVRRDDKHFECVYDTMYVVENHVSKTFSTPSTHDCRDLMNLNVMQLLLGHVCCHVPGLTAQQRRRRRRV